MLWKSIYYPIVSITNQFNQRIRNVIADEEKASIK